KTGGADQPKCIGKLGQQAVESILCLYSQLKKVAIYELYPILSIACCMSLKLEEATLFSNALRKFRAIDNFSLLTFMLIFSLS
ncbi:hypothetical protein EAY40_29165, partial [Vibrio anguillarum]|nr:hypothetical protein [Vibrio anguillarum]